MLSDIARIETFYSPNNCDNAKVRSSWNRIKTAWVELGTTPNNAMDAMQEIRAVINGRGDAVTKVLKCKDILAQHTFC